MTRKTKSKDDQQVSSTAPQKRGHSTESTPDEPPPHVEQWQEHEYQADSVQLQAKKLIEKTGSPELAKHAVDQATPSVPAGEERESHARAFGFESYATLYLASEPLIGPEGEPWRAARLGSGKWIVWQNETWPEHKVFSSYEQAALEICGGCDQRDS
jgi:hypothetical protein